MTASRGGFLFYAPAIGMADVTIKDLSRLMASFTGFPAQVRDAANRGIARATARVWADAVRNAPRSPTMAQDARATRKTRKDTSNRRKPTATTRAKPGGLERSVAMSTDKDRMEGHVFVAANSEARKYAGIIHDEKGVTWRNRGPGTIAKGRQADAKYVERAVEDNRDNTFRIIESELGKIGL
jgi:hypothetical protein